MVNVGVTSLYSLGHERYNTLTTVDRQLWSMWGSNRSIVWDMRDICKSSLVPRFHSRQVLDGQREKSLVSNVRV